MATASRWTARCAWTCSPQHDVDGNVFATMWWSLKLRLYARRNSHPRGRRPPQIRVFVMFHDPAFARSVPHSVGLQRGLVGVVHAFVVSRLRAASSPAVAIMVLAALISCERTPRATRNDSATCEAPYSSQRSPW